MKKPHLALVPKDDTPEPTRKIVHATATMAEGAYVEPSMLHTVLRKATSHLVTFATHRAMQRYRSKLYAVNRDGIRRYRTIRDDEHMYGLLILRLK